MENQRHTLAYVKRQAKKIKKERGITHGEALEIVSKQCGYSNWIHCSRMLNRQSADSIKITNIIELSFTEWLRKHVKRDSPLGDLSKDMIRDKNWPTYTSLNDYRSYLHSQNAFHGSLEALDRAWKSYTAYFRNKNAPKIGNKTSEKIKVKNNDQRKIVYVTNVQSIHFNDRTVENFVVGDKAWISWNGRKAIPVTITKVNESDYSLKIERPLREAGSSYSLYLDEVRSTPELACINRVTS